MNTDSKPDISWHRTREGLLAAETASLAFLALPSMDGGCRVAFAEDLDKPPTDWTAGDFMPISAELRSEAEFRDHVQALAHAEQQYNAPGYGEMAPGTETPWGKAQFSQRYADGIVFHETAGDGGFHLDAERNALVHPAYRDDQGWYDEDRDWAKVAVTFPALFSYKDADQILRDDYPDEYERVTGVVLMLDESIEKDRRFFVQHPEDWVVIDAIESRHRAGFVECVANRGGDFGASEVRRYLVPLAEYDAETFAFVIDERRHENYSGPSSLPGWPDQRVPNPAPAPEQQQVSQPTRQTQDLALEPRTLAQERAAMQQIDFPIYAAYKHDYTIKWRDPEHTRATLKKGDERLRATRGKDGAWSYESVTGSDHGDIVDFEIHRGARTLANARTQIRPVLELEEQHRGRLDLQSEPGHTPEPDGPSPYYHHRPSRDPDDGRRRGRGR